MLYKFRKGRFYQLIRKKADKKSLDIAAVFEMKGVTEMEINLVDEVKL